MATIRTALAMYDGVTSPLMQMNNASLTAKSNFQDVESLLERVAPENLVIDLSLLYNTYEILGKYTHAELSAYTCKQVREDVLGQ